MDIIFTRKSFDYLWKTELCLKMYDGISELKSDITHYEHEHYKFLLVAYRNDNYKWYIFSKRCRYGRYNFYKTKC